jgi:hypothetical protein
MKKRLIELRIRSISMEDDEPFAILEDRTTDRKFQIPVGPFEASAIILELEGISAPRPLAHDLLAEFFTAGGFILDKVEIFGETASQARAIISYCKGLRKFEKEVRPSDALALAIRLDSPVFAEAGMIERQEEESAPWRRHRILALSDWKARAMRA